MKRLLSFMLTLALCLPMIACGLGNTSADNGGAGDVTSTNNADTQTPETPDENPDDTEKPEQLPSD